MCLKPKVIVNRHYVKVAGSAENALQLFSAAPDLYVKVDCGLCIECQIKRGSSWRTRLLDEYKYFVDRFPKEKVHFVTLTIAPEYYHLFHDKASSCRMIRLFLERYRKRYGCSFKHYITSEYGEKRGRLHFHMISFRMLCNAKELRELWSYGRVDMQTLKGPQGISYVSGYVSKIVKGDKLTSNQPFFIAPDKKTFVLVSPKFGRDYITDKSNFDYHYSGNFLKTVRVRDNGSPFGLPRYYRKIFSPLDIIRQKRDYLASSLKLPTFPIKVYNRIFNDFKSYFDYLYSIGGRPLLLHPQLQLLKQLDFNLINSYYGKQ